VSIGREGQGQVGDLSGVVNRVSPPLPSERCQKTP
jgi:hypothetical protein